jgi:sterol 3beta-glucosyltransferase
MIRRHCSGSRCSVFGDQPFWGSQCRRLGVGATIPFARLNARRLTDGLRAVLDSRVAARAKEVARRMGEEDGVGAAVAYLEDGLRSAPDFTRDVGSAT